MLVVFISTEESDGDLSGVFDNIKRNQLLKHLKKYGASLLREGSKHNIYQKGQFRSEIPRHNEIVDELERKICKDLGIPFVR